jgi:hypothetical protein
MVPVFEHLPFGKLELFGIWCLGFGIFIGGVT